MISKGKKVRIAYNLTIEGKLIKSVGTARPLWYVHGKKEIPLGLEKALTGLKAGDRKAFFVFPKNGYGTENPKSIIEMPKARFPKKDHVIGKEISSQRDGKFFATVKEVRANTLVLNFNHPFAGKKLYYQVVVMAIEGEQAEIF